MSCPGSVRLEASVEKQPGLEDRGSPHAAEGTLAHEVAEWCLRNNWADPSDYPKADIGEEMQAGVRVYLGAVAHAMGGQARRQLLVEQRISLADLNPPTEMFGTADAIVVDAREQHVHVIDLKYGSGVYVAVEDNPQLLYYALGVMLLVAKRGVEVNAVTATIVQPRYVGVEPVRSITYSREQLDAFAAELMSAAHATTLPDAPLVPGDHCGFCRARAVCPAKWDLAQATAQSDFDVVVAPPRPETLTDDQVLRVLAVSKQLRNWLDDVDEYAKRRAEAGDALPGTKLVASRATRKWTKNAEEDFLMYDSRSYKEVLRSPAEMEKLVGRKEFQDKFVSYTTKQSGGTILVSEHDPRPALNDSGELTAIPQEIA